MGQLHEIAAFLALGLSVLAVPWVGFIVLTRRDPDRFFYANVLWITLSLLAASLVGLALLAAGPGPRDPLHLVYGALATAAWPTAAFVASGRPEVRPARIALVASIVALVLLARLFQTSGA